MIALHAFQNGSVLGVQQDAEVAAFEALVREHEAAVLRLCRRFLGDEAAAEDTLQETFIASWRKLDTLRGPVRLWLLTIAANLCRSRLRRERRMPSSSLDLALENGMPEPKGRVGEPEAAILSTALHRSIRDALLELPEDQRVALVLRDIDGFDYLEIAAATRASLGTVKSRISRARLRMRHLLSTELGTLARSA